MADEVYFGKAFVVGQLFDVLRVEGHGPAVQMPPEVPVLIAPTEAGQVVHTDPRLICKASDVEIPVCGGGRAPIQKHDWRPSLGIEHIPMALKKEPGTTRAQGHKVVSLGACRPRQQGEGLPE